MKERMNLDTELDENTIKSLPDDKLRKLANVAWYSRNTELCWLCQDELVERARECKRFSCI